MARTATFSTALRGSVILVFAPLGSIWAAVIWLVEANAHLKANTRLDAVHKDAVEAKGLIREGEIRRIIGTDFYA